LSRLKEDQRISVGLQAEARLLIVGWVFATANPCPAAGGIAFKQGPLPLLQLLGFQAQCIGCSAVNNT